MQGMMRVSNLVLVAAIVAAPLAAQSSLEVVAQAHKITASAGGFVGPLDATSSFGRRVARIGDLDGNGVTDLAVGADEHDGAQGAVWILFLGADGTVQAEQRIAPGVGGFKPLTEYTEPRFGVALAPLGDFDGDGVEDLAVGTQFPTKAWLLMLHADGTVKSWLELSLFDWGFYVGLDMTLDAVGDIDGNGVVDLFASIPMNLFGFDGVAMLLFLKPDATLQWVNQLGPIAHPRSIGSVGDIDGNGMTDVGIVGDDRIVVHFLGPLGLVQSTHVIAQGQGGFTGGPFAPSSVTSIGDFDRDGVPDLAVGSETMGVGGGVWLLFMNADGTVRAHDRIAAGEGGFAGPLAAFDGFGHAVSSLGDLDGDGTLELAVGTPGDGPDGLVGDLLHRSPGAVWILSLDGTWFDEGHAWAGISGTPLLVGTGSLAAGAPGALTLTNARPSAPCALQVALASAPAPFKGGVLVPFPPLLSLAFVTDAVGSVPLPFAWPAGLPSGTAVWFQYAIADPAAIQKVSLSNAVKAVQP